MTSRKSTSSSPHQADLSFEYESDAVAERVRQAIEPEVDDIDDDRTRARVSRDGASLSVSITARDLVALRAGVNTWVSLVGVAAATGDTLPD